MQSPLEETLLPQSDEKKKKRKSPLKQKSKQEKKKRKHRKPVVFGTTLFLMVVMLFVYSLSFLLAPSFTLKAQIRTVHGGYELVYDICTISKSALSDTTGVGDIIYMRSNGTVSKTTKDAIRMKVVSIEDGKAQLEFDVSNVPTFISTADMKAIIKSPNKGGIYSYIYVVGKIMGGKFTLQKLHL